MSGETYHRTQLLGRIRELEEKLAAAEESLWDKFFVACMSSILSAPVNFTIAGQKIGYGESEVTALAKVYADKMIEVRNAR